MSTNKPEGVDTRLRTLEECVARLIRPVPSKLISQKPDKSKADYINITTVKDLLDVACGRGNWQAEVIQALPIPPNHLGLILRLTIFTADRGPVYQDGTGHEVTDKPSIYGDPLTNAYAQALRRAAESFGMARELWRREVIGAQVIAKQLVASGAFDELPTVEEDEGPVEEGAAELSMQILEAAQVLGYDAAKVKKWVNQKYEVSDGLNALTVADRREVLKIFRSQAIPARGVGA
jgi:hypothetical protein